MLTCLQTHYIDNSSHGLDLKGPQSSTLPTLALSGCIGAPRGPLHGGSIHESRFTRAASRGLLHAGRSTGGSQILLILTCSQYLMVLLAHFFKILVSSGINCCKQQRRCYCFECLVQFERALCDGKACIADSAV